MKHHYIFPKSLTAPIPTYSTSPMTLLENDTSFINPFAQNLPSPGLGEQAQPPPYVASPTRSLSNHGGLTWNPVTEMGTAANAAALTESKMSEGDTSVVNHPQGDDNHSDEEALFHMPTQLPVDVAVGMTVSSPRMNFSDEEALFHMPNLLVDMAGGTMMSPPWMNFSDEEALFHMLNFPVDMAGAKIMSPPRMNFSLPSGDSLEISDPVSLWNYADHSGVQQLENGKEMMRATWKQPCIQVDDAALGKNQTLEPESIGGMVQHSSSSHRQRNYDHSVNCFVDEFFHMPIQLPVDMAVSSPRMNSSLPSDDSLGSFDPDSLWDDVKLQLPNRIKILRQTVKPARIEVNVSSEKNFTMGLWLELEPESRGGMMEQNSVTHPQTNDEQICQFKLVSLEVLLLYQFFRYKPTLLEELRNTGGNRLTVETKCRGGKMGHTVSYPKPGATNEERNVGLKSIDCKGNSSKKNDANCMRQEDHGITHEVEELQNAEKMAQPCSEVDTASEQNHQTPKFGLKRTGANGNSSMKKDNICRWQQDHGITREVLEQLFDKSRDDAAKTLKVSPSTFKRACRDFGITRWPNHNGKRPNSSLNQKLNVKKHKGSQPCPALPPEEGTTTSQGNSAMSVKVSYKNDTVRFPLSSSSTMKYLEEQLERKLKISLEYFSIKYQDEEDEWITLTCDSELMHGMDVLRSSGKTVIRMMVSPRFD